MFEMNTYAAEVLSAYGVSLVLLAALLVVTLRRGRKASRALDAVERDTKTDG